MDVAATDARDCELYWASLARLSTAHERLLSPVERKRCLEFRQRDDRARFVLAAALLRLASGAWLALPPERVAVDRTCDRCREQHGRPQLPGTGLHASVSHAGDYVAVALTRRAPVGVDIERIGRVAYEPLLGSVCTPSERRHVTSDADFYAYWTRKESVLKATGVGLSLPMTDVVVTPPGHAPRVVAYDGRCDFIAQMVELSFDARYACTVTVLTDSKVTVQVRGAEGLLASAHSRS